MLNMRIVRILAACMALLAAIPAAAADKTRQISDIHTVAIITALGNQADYESLGGTVFSNESGAIDISGWGLDSQVAADMTALLRDRYTMKAVDYDHVAFSTPVRRFLDVEIPLDDLLVNRPDRALVDAYVIVVPFSSGDPIGMTNAKFRGVGMSRRPFGFTHHLVADFAFFHVLVVDSITLKIIKGAPLNLGLNRFLTPVLAWKTTSEDNAPDSYAEMTEAQRQSFRLRATALVRASLKPTLAGLGLFGNGPITADNDLQNADTPLPQ